MYTHMYIYICIVYLSLCMCMYMYVYIYIYIVLTNYYTSRVSRAGSLDLSIAARETWAGRRAGSRRRAAW